MGQFFSSGGATAAADVGFENPMSAAADMIVGGASGAAARLAKGTANQVLGVNSDATALEYKTIAAGTGISVTHGANSVTIANTGVSGGVYSPDRAPSSGMVAALTDEFDGASAATWLWGNQDAATDTIELDTAFMDTGDADVTGTDGPNGRYLADPAANFQSDFMIAAKVTPLCLAAFGTVGLIVMVGGSGDPITTPTTLYTGAVYADAGLDPALAFNTKTGYTGAYSNAGSEANAQIFEVQKWVTTPIYLAMTYDAATKALNLHYSQDGMTWVNHGGTAATLAAHPSFVGRFVDANGTAAVARGRFHWFRFFTDATRWASLTSIKVGE